MLYGMLFNHKPYITDILNLVLVKGGNHHTPVAELFQYSVID